MRKNYDYVLGQNSYDCGISSIITVLRYYGINASREKIISKFDKCDNGYTAYDLICIAKMYGVKGYGLKTTIDKLNKFPVIAHTVKDKNMFHFIVILEKNNKKKRLLMMDPSEGIKEITYDEFYSITTGIFLLFEGRKKKSVKDQRFKKEIINIFKDNKKSIIQTLLLSIFCVALSLIFNYYLKIMLSNSNNMTLLMKVFIAFLQLLFLKSFLAYFKDVLTYKVSKIIDYDVTNKVCSHIFNLPYEYFIRKSTGELVSIVDDVELFKQVVTKIFILSLVDLILIVVILVYLFILDVMVATLCLVLIIIVLSITMKYQYVFNNDYIKLKKTRIDYSSSLINYLTSFETIKNLNISSTVINNLLKKYTKLINVDEKYNKNLYIYSSLLSFLTDFFYLIVIFISLYFYHNNSDPFNTVLFSSMFYFVINLLNNINDSIAFYKVYQTSTDRVLDCLEVPIEKFNNTNLCKVNNIKFVDVSYENNQNSILKNINLEIKRGGKIHITGSSGIGKSTLIKLLLNYFTPNSGNIYIDDLNIQDLDLSFIRDNITYVGQNESLFPGSILANFEFVSTDMDKIDLVSKICLLDDFFLKNNMNYDYLLEESGNNLSGGERKKIILARSLLKFKNVLVLDEVFNEISVEEEKKILANIFDYYSDKIIIVISHRNTNLNFFDRKYEIKGDGTLDEVK